MADGDARPADVLARMREIDRRKAAAGKTAEDAKLARKRERGRESVRRSKMRKRMQITSDRTQQCESDRKLSAAEKSKQYQALFGDPPAAKESPIRADLVRLSRDRKAPASARVTALRTLAEMDGLVGKLQTQADATADQSLATMSRAQLERELARLRAIVAGRDT